MLAAASRPEHAIRYQRFIEVLAGRLQARGAAVPELAQGDAMVQLAGTVISIHGRPPGGRQIALKDDGATHLVRVTLG